jgi:hypothetical protein
MEIYVYIHSIKERTQSAGDRVGTAMECVSSI